MRKQVLLACVFIAAALMSSCRKEDLDMLRNPIHVQGGITPNLQLPLASSSRMNFGDILSMFDGTFSNVMVPGTDLIIFTYDTSFSDSAPLSQMSSKGGHSPKIITHKWVEKTIDIDLFEKSDMSLVEDADITIAELMLDMEATMQTISHDTTAARLLHDYGSARLDSLQISYVGMNDVVGSLGTQNVPPLIINDLTALSTWAAEVNLAEIFNKRPKSITYRFKIDVNIDNGFMADPEMVTLAVTDPARAQEVQDSVEHAMMYYGANVTVTFPFEVRIGHLKYSYPIDINRGSGSSENDNLLRETFNKIRDLLDGRLGQIMDADLDSLVILKLVVQNGIPLNIDLNGTFLNANGDSTGVLFPYQGIPSCAVVNGEADSLNPGITNPPISIPLNMESIEKFLDTDKIRIDLLVSTNGNTPVQIKKSDGLDMKMYIQLHPKLNFNWDLTGGNNNNN